MANWQEFIKAVRVSLFGYPWMKEVLVAHAIVESNYGTTELALKHNNFTTINYIPSLARHGTKIADHYFSFESPMDFIIIWKDRWFRKYSDLPVYQRLYDRDQEVLCSAEAFIGYLHQYDCSFKAKEVLEQLPNAIKSLNCKNNGYIGDTVNE